MKLKVALLRQILVASTERFCHVILLLFLLQKTDVGFSYVFSAIKSRLHLLRDTFGALFDYHFNEI